MENAPVLSNFWQLLVACSWCTATDEAIWHYSNSEIQLVSVSECDIGDT